MGLAVKASPIDVIEYYTEDFPPYNMPDKDGYATGVNTDIVVEMLKVMKSRKTVKDIQVVTWARGYAQAEKVDSNTALYSTTRTKKREYLFKWVGPLSTSKNGLIVLKGNPKGVAKTVGGRFKHGFLYGTIKEDLGEQLLLTDGVPTNQIQSTFDFLQLINLLKSKRIDCISYNSDVAMWLIQANGFDTRDFEVIGSQEIGRHYIAFSLGVSDRVIDIHQRALDEVKTNKQFMDLLKLKWKLAD